MCYGHMMIGDTIQTRMLIKKISELQCLDILNANILSKYPQLMNHINQQLS